MFRNADRQIVAIAPDGRRFAYNASGGLYIRKMDEEEPRLIPGTEQGLVEPMFSPDGGSLAYFQDGALKKVRVDGGGAPVPLGSAEFSPVPARRKLGRGQHDRVEFRRWYLADFG